MIYIQKLDLRSLYILGNPFTDLCKTSDDSLSPFNDSGLLPSVESKSSKYDNRQEADKQCKANGVKKSTAQTIASWKNRGYIVEGAAPDTFVKTEKCKYNMCA